MKREQLGQTLQTTARVNEAYLRLVDSNEIDWQNRAHFFAIAAQIMRHLLVDRARSRRYAKRGSAGRQISLDQTAVLPPERHSEFLHFVEALNKLAAIDARKSRLVELLYFCGLSGEEAAEEILKEHQSEWLIGTQLGSYRIEALLGRVVF